MLGEWPPYLMGYDQPTNKHTKERAPDCWGLLVSQKRQVRQTWKDLPPVESCDTKP
jgi:hypothetical protein